MKAVHADKYQVLAAYFAGARFDLAIGELMKGRIFPSTPSATDASQSITHGEL